MSAIFNKIEWKQSQAKALNRQAIANLSGSGQKKTAIPQKPEISQKKELEKINNNKKGFDMVTSTIVETNSSSNTEASDQAQKFSSIKDASKKENGEQSSSKKRGRDYNSGMDLLEMDFILGVVEETTGENEYDVKMRQMCFKEMLRRESRHEIASAALKIYATKGPVYGKDIQCEAMQELTFRTIQNQ